MNIQNLTMSFGLQTIYDNVSFQINENDKQFNRYKQYVKELKKYIG